MKLPLYNQDSEQKGSVELPDILFGAKMNRDLLYQVVTSQMSNTRQVVAHTKGRGEVRGGGKKPWRQKGTGRARHGSIRSPIWKGGGVAFGPTKERNFKKKINKKMARQALAVILSSKINDKELIFVDAINFEDWKTKNMAGVINKLAGIFGGKMPSALIVTPQNASDTIVRVSKNIPNIDVMEAKDLNALQVISRKNVIVLKDAIEPIEKLLGRKQ